MMVDAGRTLELWFVALLTVALVTLAPTPTKKPVRFPCFDLAR
jgi:hypothetical protein